MSRLVRRRKMPMKGLRDILEQPSASIVYRPARLGHVWIKRRASGDDISAGTRVEMALGTGECD